MKKTLFSFTAMLICLIGFVSAGYAGRTMSDEEVGKKKEGYYPAIIPAVFANPDEGLGWALRFDVYNGGHRGDEYFNKTPYFMRLYGMYAGSTNGLVMGELDLDMPYLLGSKYRVKAKLNHTYLPYGVYFGSGADASDRKLTSPLTGKTYDKYADYQEDFLDSKDAQGRSYYRYNNYRFLRDSVTFNVTRELAEWFYVVAGTEYRHTINKAWDNRTFKTGVAGDKERSAETLFSIDPPYGRKGGWTNSVRAGVGIDTRDHEYDPHKGVFLDYMLEYYTPFLGSDYTFNRSTVGARFFLPLLDSLTLAMRGSYTDVNGRTPFNMLHYFAYSDYTYDGLGGDYSGRGYLRDRFYGKTMTLVTVEPRWTFWESASGAWKTVLVLFMDSGNVYDDGSDPFTNSRWGEYKSSCGGGIVLAYARSLLIHCYYGWSKEFSGIYLNFNHVF